MPLRSYFVFVGAALLIVLLAGNWLLPSPSSNALINSDPHLPTIRIHSELKGPDAVVIDTSRPIMTPAAPDAVAGLQTTTVPMSPAAEAVAQSVPLEAPHLRDSFAQFVQRPPKQTGPRTHGKRQ